MMMHVRLLEEVVIVIIVISHISHLTFVPQQKVDGRGALESHECIFQPLIARFNAAFLSFGIKRTFSQASSCFHIAFKCRDVAVERSHSAATSVSGCVSCWARPANLQLLPRPWASGMCFKWILTIMRKVGSSAGMCLRLCFPLLMVNVNTSACFSFVLMSSCCGNTFFECFSGVGEPPEHIPEHVLSAGDGLAEFMRRSWTEHLSFSPQTAIRAFQCRDRRRWRPVLFV